MSYCMEHTRMKNVVLGFALVVGTTIAFVAPLAGQGRGRGGPPPAPAGPMPRLPDGHPDMQGFWNPPAITDIEPAAGRGGGGRAGGGGARGGGALSGAPAGAAPAGGAPPAGGGGAIAGFGGNAGPGNRIIDPPDGKIPYKPEARAKQQDILMSHMADEPELHCYQSGVPHSESNQF